MKKILGWIVLVAVAVTSFFIVSDKRSTYYNMIKDNKDLEIKIRYKGLKKAVDFTMNDSCIYVAFESSIECIPLSGEPYELISNDDYKISTVELIGERLFFISGDTLYSVNIKNGDIKTCLADIPNKGDYSKVFLKGYGDNLYLSIGAATNSGIVSDDNQWAETNKDFHDMPPFDVSINENGRKAFKGISEEEHKEEKVKGEKPGTSCILEMNIKSMEYKIYAWGLRNVEGMDITSDGRLFAAVGGMENRGDRPVTGDSDYIYEVKSGCWYGFPDYSGGDPLNSPRFRDSKGKTQEPVMSQYPMTPLSPCYQHDSVGSLKWLSVDKGGTVSKSGKNKLYFYDSISKEIYSSDIGGYPVKFAVFDSGTGICSIKMVNESLYILDNSKGILYTLNKKEE